MAQVDVKWPSDDQDSNVKPVSAGATPPPDDESTNTEAASVAKPEATVQAAVNPVASSPTEASTATVAQPQTITPTPEPSVSSTSSEPTKTHKDREGGKHIVRLILEVFLVLVIAGLSYWTWTLYTDKQDLQQQINQLKSDPQAEAQKQADAIVASVAALRTLPKNEVPTVATVSDADSAKKQSAFFVNAKNGDKVLVYVNTGQAILYRPSTNKIILVAPLSLTNTAPAATSSTSTTPKSTNTQN